MVRHHFRTGSMKRASARNRPYCSSYGTVKFCGRFSQNGRSASLVIAVLAHHAVARLDRQSSKCLTAYMSSHFTSVLGMFLSLYSFAPFLALSGLTAAHPPIHGSGHPPPSPYPTAAPSPPLWDLKEFNTLVTFGDSYTDDSRLNYFIANGGQAPPVGWVNPPSTSQNPNSASGGYQWPQFVRSSTGVSLYNYAVSGAVCSNEITPRFLATINADFPAVAQYEVPAFIADSSYVTPNGTKFFVGQPESTVYTMWIGTNDLGVGAFLTDDQVPGTTIADYLDCVYDELEKVYQTGARYFVLFNIAPLNLAPLYGLPGQGGVGDNEYWPMKEETVDLTEVSGRMLETVATVNQVYEYRTPVEVVVERRFAGAKFAVFNVHDLVSIPSPDDSVNSTNDVAVDRHHKQPIRLLERHCAVERHWIHQPLQSDARRLRPGAKPGQFFLV
nr:acetylesterase [Quercus suber]